MNKLTRFLLYCSGADRTILAEAPEYERTKYVCIGGTVLFTGIFAAVAGGYALYRVFYIEPELIDGQWVHDNTPVLYGIIFGLFWGYLIFNLDKFIVSSMKKTNFFREFVMVIPRLALAAIISFVISKPLEVKLFENRLAAFIQQEKINQDSIYSTKILNTLAIGEKESDFSNASKALAAAEKKRGSDPDTRAFRNLQSRHRRCMTELSRLTRNTPGQVNNLRLRLEDVDRPSSILDGVPQYDAFTKAKIETIKTQIKSLEDAKENKEERCVSIASEITRLRRAHNRSVEKEITSKSDVLASKESDFSTSKSQSEKEIASMRRANKRSYSENFITQLEALGRLTKKNYAEDENGNSVPVDNTMYWASIMLMLLFFVVETTPVLVKLISPKGPYDILLKETERFVLEASKDDTDVRIKLNRRQNKSIYKSDKLANDEVISKVSEAQVEIAEGVVSKWKDEELKRMLEEIP